MITYLQNTCAALVIIAMTFGMFAQSLHAQAHTFTLDPQTYQAVLASVDPEMRPAVAAVLSSYVVASPASSASFDRSLRKGMSGDDVSLLQQKLNTATGTRLSIDGQFTPATSTVLQAFQRQHGLEIDGVAGPAVFAKLDTVAISPAPILVPPQAQFIAPVQSGGLDIAKALEALQDVETATTTITMQPDLYFASFANLFLEEAGEVQYMNYSGNIVIDATEDCENGYPCDSDVSISVETKGTEPLLGGDLDEKIEVRTLGDDSYVRVHDTEYLQSVLVDELLAYTDTWIHGTAEDIADLFGVSLDDLQSSFEEDEAFVAEIYEEIIRLMQAYNPVTSSRIVGSESIDGVAVDHYVFDMSRSALIRIFMELGVYLDEDLRAEFESISEQEIQELIFELEAETQSVESEYHMWVARDTYIPYRIDVHIKQRKQEDSFMFGDMSFSIELRNVNEQVSIEKPSRTIPLDDVIETIEDL